MQILFILKIAILSFSENINTESTDRDKEMTDVNYLQSDDEIDEVDAMTMNATDDLELDDDKSLQTDDWTDEEELLDPSVDDEIIDNWTVDDIESDIKIVCDQEIIISLVQKCRRFVSMVKRSTIITLFFDAERKRQRRIEIYVMT